MSGPAGAAHTAAMAGHTRVSTQALTSVAQAAAAEALGVPPQEVRAEWSDDDGLLALSLVAPITVPPLTTVVRDAGRVAGLGGSIWDRASGRQGGHPAPRDRAERCPAEQGGHPDRRRQHE